MGQQMTIDKKNSYVEVLEILKYMDKIYIDKIPNKLIEFFEKNKSDNYEFKYNENLDLEKQNLNENTLAILAMLNLNYWCEDEEHKKELISKYNENENKYQEELRKKYNPDDLFRKKNTALEQKVVPKEVTITKYKESIFKKLINKIKSFLHL